MLRTVFGSFLLGLALTLTTFGQNPAHWSLESDAKGKDLESGSAFKADLKVDIDEGWHLYSLDQPAGGPTATTIKVAADKPFVIDGAIKAPPATTKPDRNFPINNKPLLTRFFTKSAVFSIPLKATASTAADELGLNVRFQVCNDTTCLPPKTVLITFAGEQDLKRTPAATPAAVAAPHEPTPERQPGNGPPTDLWPFIWVAITLGALSLLTPCVFPMIPITVSYFTNHAGGSRSGSLKLAAVYSIGIVATFTILGMLLAIFVGAAGINLFAANPWVNLVITAIFVLFAFNLFGAYEITVPTGLLTKLDRLTRSKEGEGSGVVGALLMGLTFTLTSFTCTSPFVGTILVSASQGKWQMPLVGMLAFSTVFALPFFLLALAPQYLAKLPRAGGWMNSVKVAMGFLELAAAMKFVSNVDLVWGWGFFTRNIVLAIWTAIGVILTVYLLGKFQLAHDSKPERLGAFRMFWAMVSLAVSFYLLTGLFGGNLGELESFLPPSLDGQKSLVQKSGEKGNADWILNDYAAATAKAKAENKPIFVDFTGYTCTNCRWMEANVFPKNEVQKELGKYVLLRLYTDGEGEVYDRQQQMEQDLLGTVALPYYVVLDPNGGVKQQFPGLTRNVTEFVDFLRAGQQN